MRCSARIPMKPAVIEGKEGWRCILAECRSTIQQSPEDILPIDRREEEEGAQSALMNAEPRGPYSVHLRPATSFPPLFSPSPSFRRHPLPVGRFYGGCRAQDIPRRVVVLNFREKSKIFFPPLFRGTDNYEQ